MSQKDPDLLWKQWKASPSPKSLSAVVGSLSGSLDRIVSSSPGLSPTLVRSKGRNLLIQAIRSYDPAFGASLQTHAHNHLKPLASRGYTMARAVPRTRYKEDIARSLHNELMAAEQRGEEEPDAKQLAKRLKLPIGTVENFLSGLAYEAPEGSLESTPMAGKGGDDDRVAFWTEMVYNDLPEQHKRIFDLRTGKDGAQRTLGDIAKETGVSPSYVHKITSNALGDIMKGVNAPHFNADELEDEPEIEPEPEAADLLNGSIR